MSRSRFLTEDILCIGSRIKSSIQFESGQHEHITPIVLRFCALGSKTVLSGLDDAEVTKGLAHYDGPCVALMFRVDARIIRMRFDRKPVGILRVVGLKDMRRYVEMDGRDMKRMH